MKRYESLHVSESLVSGGGLLLPVSGQLDMCLVLTQGGMKWHSVLAMTGPGSLL